MGEQFRVKFWYDDSDPEKTEFFDDRGKAIEFRDRLISEARAAGIHVTTQLFTPGEIGFELMGC